MKIKSFIAGIYVNSLTAIVLLATFLIGFSVYIQYSSYVKEEKNYYNIYLANKKRTVEKEVFAVSEIPSYVANFSTDSLLTQRIKELVADYVRKRRFGVNNTGYLFIVKVNGDVVEHPISPELNGKNLWEMRDADGVKIFQIMADIALSDSGCGFLSYKWFNPRDSKVSSKITYVRYVKAFGWIIGAGIYLADFKNEIESMQNKNRSRLVNDTMKFVVSTIVVILLLSVLLRLIFSKLQKDFSYFTEFFRNASRLNKRIDIKSINFREFVGMANYANEMLEDKIAFEVRLNEDKKRLETILYTIKEAVITTNQSGYITFANEMTYELYGVHGVNFIGKFVSSVLNLRQKDDLAKKYNPVEILNESKEDFILFKNIVAIGKLNQQIDIAGSAVTLKYGDKVRGYIIVFRDVTEEIKEEQEKIRIDKLNALGVLAGGIAHDFNNILTGITGSISIVKAMVNDRNIQGILEMTRQSAIDAAGLTQKLLTFSKGGNPIKESLKIKDFIETCVEFNILGSGIDLEVNIPDDIKPIRADRNQFSQVLSNLVINARQAMHENGKLSISAKNIPYGHSEDERLDKSQYVRITVADTGGGVSSEIVDNIFDPYFTTKEDGNGIGLATVFSIVSKHGGIVKFKNTPGIGASFIVYFPVDEKQQSGINISKRRTAIYSRKDMKNIRILLMDDDPVVREVATLMATELGHTIVCVENGTEAISLTKKYISEGKSFDLYILDLTIRNGLGGKKTIKELLEIDSSIRAIVSSGYSSDPVVANYKKYGFFASLPKPYTIEEFKDVINTVI